MTVMVTVSGPWSGLAARPVTLGWLYHHTDTSLVHLLLISELSPPPPSPLPFPPAPFLRQSEELCQRRGGRPGLPVPGSPCGLSLTQSNIEGTIAACLFVGLDFRSFRNCVRVEVDVVLCVPNSP